MFGMSYEEVREFITVDSDMEIAFGSWFGNTCNLLPIGEIDLEKLDMNINIRSLEIDDQYVSLIVSNENYRYLLGICKE